jgi:hypothetical protein
MFGGINYNQQQQYNQPQPNSQYSQGFNNPQQQQLYNGPPLQPPLNQSQPGYGGGLQQNRYAGNPEYIRLV